MANAGWDGNTYWANVNANTETSLDLAGKSGTVTMYDGGEAQKALPVICSSTVDVLNISSSVWRSSNIVVSDLDVNGSNTKLLVSTNSSGKKTSATVKSITGTLSAAEVNEGQSLTVGTGKVASMTLHNNSALIIPAGDTLTVTNLSNDGGTVTVNGTIKAAGTDTRISDLSISATSGKIAGFAQGGMENLNLGAEGGHTITLTLTNMDAVTTYIHEKNKPYEYTLTSTTSLWNVEKNTLQLVAEGYETATIYRYDGQFYSAFDKQGVTFNYLPQNLIETLDANTAYLVIEAPTNTAFSGFSIIVTPEPTTATLSLLALAALASRRKRY